MNQDSSSRNVESNDQGNTDVHNQEQNQNNPTGVPQDADVQHREGRSQENNEQLSRDIQNHLQAASRIRNTLSQSSNQSQTTSSNLIQNLQSLLRQTQSNNQRIQEQVLDQTQSQTMSDNLVSQRELDLQQIRQAQQQTQEILASVQVPQASSSAASGSGAAANEERKNEGERSANSSISVQQYLSRLQGIRQRYGSNQQLNVPRSSRGETGNNTLQTTVNQDAVVQNSENADNVAQQPRQRQDIQTLLRNHQRIQTQTRNNHQVGQRPNHFLSESVSQSAQDPDNTNQYNTQGVHQQSSMSNNINSTNFSTVLAQSTQRVALSNQGSDAGQGLELSNENGAGAPGNLGANIIQSILRMNRHLGGSSNRNQDDHTDQAIQSQQLILDSIQNQNNLNQLQNNRQMINSNNGVANRGSSDQQENTSRQNGQLTNAQNNQRQSNSTTNNENMHARQASGVANRIVAGINLERNQNSHSTLNEEDMNDLFQNNSSQDNDTSSNSNSDNEHESANYNRLAQIALRQREMDRQQRDWQRNEGLPALIHDSDSDDNNNLASQVIQATLNQENENSQQTTLDRARLIQQSRILEAIGQRESQILASINGQSNLNQSSDGIDDYNNLSNSSQDDAYVNVEEDRGINLNLREALGIGNSNQLQQINSIANLNSGNSQQATASSRVLGDAQDRNNRQDRLNNYPLQDDIDDNDDVVSMSDSLNINYNQSQQRNGRSPLNAGANAPNLRDTQYRLGDVGTIQSINARRLMGEQNSGGSGAAVTNRVTHRHQREELKTNANQNIDEIFKCFICFGKISDAVLCPSCSKLCCRDCIRKWLTEQRQQCPHCRSALQVHQLVNCRFVEELTAAIDTLNQPLAESARNDNLADGSLLRNGVEVCAEHGAALDYYCQTCKIPICSECAMFGGDKHKDHKFLRLAEVYDKHCDVIKKEATGLKKRLKELTKYMQEVQITIEKVTRAKEDKCKEIENFVENIQAKLNTQLKNKLLTLLSQRQSMQDEIEQLEEFHNKLNQELTKMPKSSLIKKSKDLIRQLKEIHNKEPHRFVDNEVSINFSSELVPQYEKSEFVIRNFSRIRQNQNQMSEENEIVYSDPPLVTKSGLTWRLKVYPNGNGIAKGNYISVFLEMLKGLPDSQTQKYEYRVEMINHRNPSAQVVREFASEFEVGECWGYNRFYRIDLLDREGYLNHVDDSITLKFFVRAPYYSQHCSDQERYILNLQRIIENKDKEIQQLQENYSEAQKKIKNQSRPKKLKQTNLKDDHQNENNQDPLEENKHEENECDINDKQTSQKYLKDLKEKQKQHEQKVALNQNQIRHITMKKKSSIKTKNDEHVKNPFIQRESNLKEEEKDGSQNIFNNDVIQPRKSNQHLQTQKFSINMQVGQKQKPNPAAQKTEPQEPESSNQMEAAAINYENSGDDNKSDVVEIDFYQNQNNKSNESSTINYQDFPLSKNSSNESSDSPDSNKLLRKFQNGEGANNQYDKAKYGEPLGEYNQEDHYERVLNDNPIHYSEKSSGVKSSQNSSDSINEDDNISHNEDEKRENRQYQMLKQSLKALQQRANNTLNNKGVGDGQQDLSKNYSVSSEGPQNGEDGSNEEQAQDQIAQQIDKTINDVTDAMSPINVSDSHHLAMISHDIQNNNDDEENVADTRLVESYIQSSFDIQEGQSFNNQSYQLIDDSMDLADSNQKAPEDIFKDESNQINAAKSKPLQIKASQSNGIKKRFAENQTNPKNPVNQIEEEAKIQSGIPSGFDGAKRIITKNIDKSLSQAKLGTLNEKILDKKKQTQALLQKTKNPIQISQGKIIKKLSISSSQKNIK